MSKNFLKIISAAIMFLSVSLCSVTVTKAEPEFDINARAGLLMEYETGTILYEKNIDQPLPIASVTKIMSLCLIFDEVEQGTLKPVSYTHLDVYKRQVYRLDAGINENNFYKGKP